ncbi:tetratricopeptide repeat protein, partial [Candidatus Cloacimonadota bacterium]
MRIALILALVTTSFCLQAEILTYDKVLKNLKGIKEYENEDFQSSEELFNENSVNNPLDGRLHYNKANSQYKTGKLEEAEQEYNLALKDNNFGNRSKALHNLGNIKFQQQDYKEAIKHFRNALVEDPSNLDARYNYELASRFLQQQQQQQQQSQDN